MSSNQSDGAVVTGAASGIGRAIAAGLAADGFSVVIADLDEENGRAAAEEIAGSNQNRAIFQRVDVTNRTSVSAAIDACTRQFGSIKVGRCSLLRKNIAWSPSNITYDRLTAPTYGDMANS